MLLAFYYSDEASLLLINNSKLMKEIKENEIYINPIESYIDDKYIIVGINGLETNLLASYYNMLNDGIFNKSKMVFNEVSPKINKFNNPTLIIKGSFKNAVSIIIDNKELENYAIETKVLYSSLNELKNSNICIENSFNNCNKYIKPLFLTNQNFINYNYNSGSILYLDKDFSLNNFKLLISKFSFYNIEIIKIDNLISEQRLK